MHISSKFYSLLMWIWNVIILSDTLGLCNSLFNTEIIARLTLLAHCNTWSCAWEPTEELSNALEKEILKCKVIFLDTALLFIVAALHISEINVFMNACC